MLRGPYVNRVEHLKTRFVGFICRFYAARGTHKTMSQSTTTSPSPSNPVVASLPNRSPHPYSSIAMSPSRQYAIIAGKDTLQLVKISPSGLTPCKTIQISQVSSMHRVAWILLFRL